jgi:hypothetical protein
MASRTTAAAAVGLATRTLKRYLDRGSVRAVLLRERRIFRAAINGGNELALKRVRDRSKNGMCVVASVRQLEAMAVADGGRDVSAPSPGVTIVIRHAAVPEQTIIDATPQREPEPVQRFDPIFRLP